jgi:serine/threonine-protein kinase
MTSWSSRDASNPAVASSAAFDERELQPGDRVGEYEVEGKLGQGGMGAVYLATHTVIGKRAAIKVLLRRLHFHPDAIGRFLQEARLVNQVRHRNIIEIFDFGQLTDGQQYYVMEYLDGVSLRQHLTAHGPPSLTETLSILRQVARGLDAAHAKGIVHRDLKPDNIFLTRQEDGPSPYLVKLLDFGIAKLTDVETNAAPAVYTGTGITLGTPHYMSPEQCLGRALGPASDIYALGVVMYEMLTGAVPFPAENVAEMVMFQQLETPQCPSNRSELVSPHLDAPIMRALQKGAEDRYDRATDFIDAVELVAQDLTASGSTDAWLRSATTAPSLTAISTGGWFRRNASTFYIGGAVAMALLGTGGGMMLRRRRAPSASSAAPSPPADGATIVSNTAAAVPRVASDELPLPNGGRADPPAVPPAPKATVVPELARVRVIGHPAEAQVVGAHGRVLGKVGDSLELPRQGGAQSLSVSAPGYVAKVVRIDPATESQVVVELRRAPSRPTPVARTVAAASARSPSAARGTSSPPSAKAGSTASATAVPTATRPARKIEDLSRELPVPLSDN